jgi:hypothetical protein
MYVYQINKQIDYLIEKYSEEGVYTTTEVVDYSLNLAHENKYEDHEFEEICKKAKQEILEVWGEDGVNYKLVSHLINNYGFSKLKIQGSYTYRFWK